MFWLFSLTPRRVSLALMNKSDSCHNFTLIQFRERIHSWGKNIYVYQSIKVSYIRETKIAQNKDNQGRQQNLPFRLWHGSMTRGQCHNVHWHSEKTHLASALFFLWCIESSVKTDRSLILQPVLLMFLFPSWGPISSWHPVKLKVHSVESQEHHLSG